MAARPRPGFESAEAAMAFLRLLFPVGSPEDASREPVRAAVT